MVLLLGLLIQEMTKLGVRIGEGARYRASRDAEDVADLGLGQIGDMPEHDHFTLPPGKFGEQQPHLARGAGTSAGTGRLRRKRRSISDRRAERRA